VPLVKLPQLPGSRIELWQITSAGKNLLAETNTSQMHGTALFGREMPIDQPLLTDWEHELRMGGAEGAALSQGYLAWRHPLVVPLKITLVPGMKLEARFVPRDQAAQTATQFTVTLEPLQDILLPGSAN
jgi:hypothetical protein